MSCLIALLACAAWHPLPQAYDGGFSCLEAVRLDGRALVIAGASYRADHVYALDLRSKPSPAPLHWRSGQRVVAGGGAALVWGGTSNVGNHADGAAYRRRWRRLPRAPLRGRAFHSAVWTGREMIVWDGKAPGPLADGAAYRPATRRWRRLARSPLRGRGYHTAVWTGRQMLVWGGRLDRGQEDFGRYARDGAVYVPGPDRWPRRASQRRLHPCPSPGHLAAPVAQRAGLSPTRAPHAGGGLGLLRNFGLSSCGRSPTDADDLQVLEPAK